MLTGYFTERTGFLRLASKASAAVTTRYAKAHMHIRYSMAIVAIPTPAATQSMLKMTHPATMPKAGIGFFLLQPHSISRKAIRPLVTLVTVGLRRLNSCG